MSIVAADRARPKGLSLPSRDVLREDWELYRKGVLDRKSLIEDATTLRPRNTFELVKSVLVEDAAIVDPALLIRHAYEIPCLACERYGESQDDCPRDGSLFRDARYENRRRVLSQVTRRHNLRVNSGIDWQSFVMGGYSQIATGSTFFLGFGGTTTSALGATTVTDTGQAWTTNQWQGHIVVVPTSTANIDCWGVVCSNTATALTVEAWRTGAGAAATQSATTNVHYLILPGQAPAMWMALSTTNSASVATDTTMAGEITTGTTLVRKLGAPSGSRTLATTSFNLAATWTYDGTTPASPVTIYRLGMFLCGGAATSNGPMAFETLLNAQAQVAANGDALTVTWTANI